MAKSIHPYDVLSISVSELHTVYCSLKAAIALLSEVDGYGSTEVPHGVDISDVGSVLIDCRRRIEEHVDALASIPISAFVAEDAVVIGGCHE